MTESEVKKVLDELYTKEEVTQHLRKIRMLNKGYWVEHDALEYVKQLLKK